MSTDHMLSIANTTCDGENLESSDVVNLTTMKNYHYIYTKEIILWKFNEKQFHINLPCIYCIVGAIILGIFGNGTALYVFGFKMKKNNTNIFIMWLSVCDFVTSFLLIFEVFDKRLPMYSGHLSFLCKTVRFLLVFMNSAAAFFLLCIAFDRYFKVCKPLKRMSTRNTKRAIFTAFLLPLLGGWPMALFHGPEKRYTKFAGVYGIDCADDERYVGALTKKVFYFLSVLITFSSIVIILVLYGVIFHAIRQWKRTDIGETSRMQKGSKIKHMEKRTNNDISIISKRMMHYTCRRGGTNLTSMKTSTQIDACFEPSCRICRYNSNGRNETLCEHTKSCGNLNIKLQEHGCSSQSVPDFTVLTEVSAQAGADESERATERWINQTSCIGKNEKYKEAVLAQRRNISRTTIMFAVVSILYILSFLPTMTVEAMNAFGAIYEADIPYTAKQLVVIANISYFLNGSLNPLVYLAFNKTYRLELLNFLK